MTIKQLVEQRREQLRKMIDDAPGSKDKAYRQLAKEMGIGHSTLKCFYANLEVSLATMFLIDEYFNLLQDVKQVR